MADIEKVIKGLECCSAHKANRCDSNTCPYWESEVCCIDEMLDDAHTLLKEQEEEIENLKQTAQSMMEGVCLLKEQEAETEWCERCGRVRLKSKWEGR